MAIKLSKTTVILFIIILALLAYILADKGLMPLVFKSGLFSREATEVLSKDQKKVIDKIGYPDVFVIMMENGKRKEIWTYFEKGINCLFSDRKMLGLNEQNKLNKDFHHPTLKPTQFFSGMTEKDVIKILSEPPLTAEGTIGGIDGKVKIFDYFSQVKVGMIEGEVVYVQTLPIAVR